MKRIKAYFSKTDISVWAFSVIFVVASFIIFDRTSYLKLAATLIGVTSLIFNAKGNPTGLVLMIIFSIMYGITSYSFSYYGEMITYLGMTLPMSAIALASWLRHPFNGKKAKLK